MFPTIVAIWADTDWRAWRTKLQRQKAANGDPTAAPSSPYSSLEGSYTEHSVHRAA